MLINHVKKSTVYLSITVTIYCVISKIIFDNIYLTSKLVVDEEFHIPLGIAYCKGEFNKWDPKVTTLPGVYGITSFVLGPLGLCTDYALRFLSLTCSVINIFLYYYLFSRTEKGIWNSILSAVTLTTIPPVYFFSHLYYTDVIALTLILGMVVLCENGHHYISSFLGFLSVCCRQTNIVWMAFYAGRLTLSELYRVAMHRSTPPCVEEPLSIHELRCLCAELLRRPLKIIMNTSLHYWLQVSSYGATLAAMVIFIILNGSIVVGDKDAHVTTIHIPQLFYFSLFCLIFAWPHFVSEVINFTKFAICHKLLILACILVGIIIVFFNTQVHPYLLADNRHYVFYLWNRFYGKYALFRYLMVPVYVFAWYVILKVTFDSNDIRFFLFYFPCIILLLVPHPLIEIRYYFLPYIFFRLRIKTDTSTVFNVVLEFVTYCVMNTIAFNIFFTKTIVWQEYDTPQRIIW